MKQKVTRRRFGQLAIASTTVAGISYFASRSLAQIPNLVIVGVRPGRLTTTDTALTAVNRIAASTDILTTEEDTVAALTTTLPSITRKLDLLSLNVAAGQIQSVIAEATQNGTTALRVSQGDETTPILQAGEQITGFTTLANGRLIVAITPASTSNQGGNPTRLITLGVSPQPVTVSGLSKQEALESLLVLNDNSLIGLIVQKDGTPPVRLVKINPETGALSTEDRIVLPTNQRFSTLAQCPDGNIYTTSVARDGKTSLVRLDLAQNQLITVNQLRLNNSVWNNGLQSLVCSPGGQLFALGALWHETHQHLHTVDPTTGNMTRLQAFDAVKIALARG